MAEDFVIYTNAGEYIDAYDAALEALDEVTRLEKLLSYFDEESEISRINQLADRDFVETTEEVYSILKYCNDLFFRTDGAFDITSTALWEAWGFMKRRPRLPSEEERREALERVSSRKILWDDARYALRFTQKGMRISLGSVGKGLATDAASAILRASGMENFLLCGGVSSVFASGARRGRNDWLVGLQHPASLKERLGEIPLENRALGTSGSATQFFWQNGKRYGHVLDPRSGLPVTNVLSVSVVAPTAAEADALATAFYVMGVDATRDFCKNRPDLSVLFVLPKVGSDCEIHFLGESCSFIPSKKERTL